MTPRIRLAKPQADEAEVEAIRSVLASGILTNGPKTEEFERAFAELHEVPHAVALANGTVALAAMLLASDIGPGDEVIVPSMTFVSTATAVRHVGATPVFADIHADTFDLDPEDVARRITSRTKAVMVVHYGGQPADLPGLAALAEDRGILLLEDAAQAHGARLHGRYVGGWGRAAMFSFTPTKNITTGEGGIVTTADADVAERLRLLRNHGMTAPYRHEVLGFNWRLTELQAAMGVVQLGRLSGILATKRRNAERMAALLRETPGVRPPTVRDGAEHPFMLYTVLLDERVDRDAVLAELQEAGIEAKVYFPPVHRQPIFRDVAGAVRLDRTEDVARRMLSLPFHAALTDEELEFLAERLTRAVTARLQGAREDRSGGSGPDGRRARPASLADR